MSGALCHRDETRPAPVPWPLNRLGLSRRTGSPAGSLSLLEPRFDPAAAPEVRSKNGGEFARSDSAPRVAVLGLARSGLAAAKLLLARDCQVELWDLRRPHKGALSGQLDECLRAGGRLRLGPHQPEWLETVDLLVKSPGVDPRIPFLAEARERGVPIVGELELASLAAEGPLVALTGTNGKSTTTAWVGDMFERSGQPVEVVGNIGRAFSEGVLASPRSVFVTEVSSFQLEDIATFRPKVAACLNFSSDHLDRHGRLEDYRAAKLRIFENQSRDDIAVLGPDPCFDAPSWGGLALERQLSAKSRCLRVRFEDRGEDGAFVREERVFLRMEGETFPSVPVKEIALRGRHNLANAMTAAVTAYAAGADTSAIDDSLRNFSGLPHRLEPIGSVRGVGCVNDSKATNVDSLSVALQSFSDPVHLIAGGVGKGQDFSALESLVRSQTAAVYLIGEAAEELTKLWSGAEVRSFPTLQDALLAALAAADGSGTVLLSPGCASFDMFKDYEDRGDAFRALVTQFRESQGA